MLCKGGPILATVIAPKGSPHATAAARASALGASALVYGRFVTCSKIAGTASTLRMNKNSRPAHAMLTKTKSDQLYELVVRVNSDATNAPRNPRRPPITLPIAPWT
eukprot:Amastigsp_a1451_35.p6 type:complete len:106 gc:universal Amastigsp_a1451_35:465-782(+)